MKFDVPNKILEEFESFFFQFCRPEYFLYAWIKKTLYKKREIFFSRSCLCFYVVVSKIFLFLSKWLTKKRMALDLNLGERLSREIKSTEITFCLPGNVKGGSTDGVVCWIFIKKYKNKYNKDTMKVLYIKELESFNLTLFINIIPCNISIYLNFTKTHFLEYVLSVFLI